MFDAVVHMETSAIQLIKGTSRMFQEMKGPLNSVPSMIQNGRMKTLY